MADMWKKPALWCLLWSLYADQVSSLAYHKPLPVSPLTGTQIRLVEIYWQTIGFYSNYKYFT